MNAEPTAYALDGYPDLPVSPSVDHREYLRVLLHRKSMELAALHMHIASPEVHKNISENRPLAFALHSAAIRLGNDISEARRLLQSANLRGPRTTAPVAPENGGAA